MNELRILIENIVREYLTEEGRFSVSQFPYNSRSHRERNVGNPIISHGNGNHSNQDVVSQVSTVDDNGANFDSGQRHYCISEKNMIKYKWYNFGNTQVKSTMDFFGGNMTELRREIDRLNGAATRNKKSLIYRTITSKDKSNMSDKSDHMLYTFWEFSFDGGQTWYLMIPNGTDKMKKSKMIAK